MHPVSVWGIELVLHNAVPQQLLWHSGYAGVRVLIRTSFEVDGVFNQVGPTCMHIPYQTMHTTTSQCD